MPRYDFIVIGAGPAGAAFAYYAASEGYSVAVYDMAPKPAMKPCGWVVPLEVNEYLRLPPEIVLQKVRGYRVFLDGRLLGEEYNVHLGYHVDKPSLIKWLLESTDTIYGKYIEPKKVKDQAHNAVIYAGGGYKVRGERIFAIQAIYKLREPVNPEIVEIWFDRSLVGYYWFFPETETRVKIGVGGFASYTELVSRLHAFAKRKEIEERLTPIKGAWIYVGGVKPDFAKQPSLPVIGEAAGFVYPISGEGIRPSIASAKAIFDYLVRGEEPRKVIGKVIAWIERQRRLLMAIKRGSPETRAAVLASLPPRLAVKIAMGTASLQEILSLALKTPGKIAKLLRLLVMGKEGSV